jgi:hypothetical protein
MGETTPKELCQRLKSEAMAKQNIDVNSDLRLRILDYLVARDLADRKFEQILRARIADPDPAKQESKLICADILQEWENRSS